MRVWTLSSALPLPLGRPRQRLAEALRLWLEARADEVRHVTIDLRGSETEARLLRAAGEMFVPPRGRGGRLPRAFEPRPDHETQWLSPGRRERLAAMLGRDRPDLVVVGDPLLAPLARTLAAAPCEVRLIDDGEAEWHALAARRLLSPGAAAWHLRMADLLRASAAAFAPLLSGPPDAGPAFGFAADERFFDKIPGITLLASGHAEPDRLALSQTDRALGQLAAHGLPRPEVALVGFAADAGPVPEGAVRHDGWMHLAGLAGSARALVLPVLTPPLAVVARAALAVGTPVVTAPAEAALAGLGGLAGLATADPATLPAVLARLLDPDLAGPADWRAIAAAAAAAPPQRRMRPLATREDRAEARAEARAARPRHRRILPLVGQPEALWNPLSRMLLVRVQFRRDSGAEDLRLIDAHGTELIRLMPNVNERKLDPVRIEGGVVIDLEALGGHLTVELHDAGSCLQAATIATQAIQRLEAEIAWVAQDGVMLTGALWLSDAAAAGGALVMSSGDRLAAPELGPPLAMPEVGGQARRFALPMDLAAKVPVAISQRRPGPWASVEALEQRPLVPTPALLAAAAAPPPGPDLAALQGRHAGQRGWIIGNGPSVRLDDLAAIPEGDVKFCFNRFYLSYDSHPLREDYVVSADTLMIADFGQDMIERSTGLPLFCLARAALPRLEGPHVVLPPFDGYLPLFSMNPAAYVGVGGSSVCVALQMAHWMGLRDVVLYGIDYSFSMKLMRDPRFPFPVSYDDGNHFIASYRSAKPWCPPTWRDISAGFLNARVAYETTGGQVRNATRGGRLETFARVDFDALLGRDPAPPGAEAVAGMMAGGDGGLAALSPAPPPRPKGARARAARKG